MTKKDKNIKTTKCIICNNDFKGYGHNPAPLASSNFRCCDGCNTARVVPYRVYKLMEEKTADNMIKVLDGESVANLKSRLEQKVTKLEQELKRIEKEIETTKNAIDLMERGDNAKV
jgi:predicted ribosome quality control (RQC) complex YloA/Tae2 family protein